MAKQLIPAGTFVKPRMYDLVTVPEDEVEAGTLTDLRVLAMHYVAHRIHPVSGSPPPTSLPDEFDAGRLFGRDVVGHCSGETSVVGGTCPLQPSRSSGLDGDGIAAGRPIGESR